MASLKVSETYPSMQGEGAFTGRPTLFVRMAGCNMRCPGWPCDTPHAIFPEIWNKEASRESSASLSQYILDTASHNGLNHICWTGGEPFMQPLDKMGQVVRFLNGSGMTQEVFTNGSYRFPAWALQYMHFMMDWKLGGSGEAETEIDTRISNALLLGPEDGIKFVVTGLDDLKEAVTAWRWLREVDCKARFWVGTTWGTISNEDIVNFVFEHKLNWSLNVQMHKYIWDPDERGV